METARISGEADGPTGGADPPEPRANDGSGKWPHFAGAAGTLAIGVAAVVGSLELGYWNNGPGSGFFPLWMGILLSGLAITWAVQTHRSATIVRHAPPPQGARRDVVLVLAGMGAVAALLDVLGYQLTMFLFVLYVLLFVGRRRWWEALIFAVAAGVGVYVLFANVLQVYLPVASLGFLAQLGL